MANDLHMMRLDRAHRLFREGDDFLMALAVDDAMQRVDLVKRDFRDAVALFGRTSALADRLHSHPSVGNVIRVEEAGHFGEPDVLATPDRPGLKPASVDLVVAPLTLHWARDLPGVFIQIAEALRPDGLFLCSLPAPETLSELRQTLLQAESETSPGAAQRVDLFTDIQDAGALLQRAGFALPVADRETVTIRYDDVLSVIKDLRRFGATSRDANPQLARPTLARLQELYAEHHADPDGRVRATFSFISMSGWKPHESQQKPLKPGSAQASLADALNKTMPKI